MRCFVSTDHVLVIQLICLTNELTQINQNLSTIINILFVQS